MTLSVLTSEDFLRTPECPVFCGAFPTASLCDTGTDPIVSPCHVGVWSLAPLPPVRLDHTGAAEYDAPLIQPFFTRAFCESEGSWKPDFEAGSNVQATLIRRRMSAAPNVIEGALFAAKISDLYSNRIQVIEHDGKALRALRAFDLNALLPRPQSVPCTTLPLDGDYGF